MLITHHRNIKLWVGIC